MRQCPRCAKPLEEEQLDNFVFRVCRQCRGILGRHADVIEVVDGSWRAVSEKDAEEQPLHVKPEAFAEPALRCPDCQSAMEKYGYLGMKAVQIDRCDRCALMWLDADELQNMVLALARDNYRAAHQLRNEEAHQLDLLGGNVPPLQAAQTGGMWLFPNRGGVLVDVIAGQLLRALLRG